MRNIWVSTRWNDTSEYTYVSTCAMTQVKTHMRWNDTSEKHMSFNEAQVNTHESCSLVSFHLICVFTCVMAQVNTHESCHTYVLCVKWRCLYQSYTLYETRIQHTAIHLQTHMFLVCYMAWQQSYATHWYVDVMWLMCDHDSLMCLGAYDCCDAI